MMMSTTILAISVYSTLAQYIVLLFGIFLIAVSIFMFVCPKTAKLYLSKAASTNLINYSELSLRGICGIGIVLSAELSKFPEFFQVFGTFMVITAAILFFIPRKWHARYAIWTSEKLSVTYLRILSPLSLTFGIFLIYAVV